jgi:hypothetical protein
LCGHYSHGSLGTEECFYGSSIPDGIGTEVLYG